MACIDWNRDLGLCGNNHVALKEVSCNCIMGVMTYSVLRSTYLEGAFAGFSEPLEDLIPAPGLDAALVDLWVIQVLLRRKCLI